MNKQEIDNIIIRDLKVVLPILWILTKILFHFLWFILKMFVPLIVVAFILFWAYDIIKVIIFLCFLGWWWGKLGDKEFSNS